MKNIKKVLRLLLILLLFLLALSGISIFGNFLNTNREPYRNKEIRVERMDKKNEEDESEDETKN